MTDLQRDLLLSCNYFPFMTGHPWGYCCQASFDFIRLHASLHCSGDCSRTRSLVVSLMASFGLAPIILCAMLASRVQNIVHLWLLILLNLPLSKFLGILVWVPRLHPCLDSLRYTRWPRHPTRFGIQACFLIRAFPLAL